MGFAYSILLKLLYPTSMALLLLLASAFLRRRASCSQQPGDSQPSVLRYRLSSWCFWLAVSILLICGNGWVVKYSTRYLERQYSPLSSVSSAKQPESSQVPSPGSTYEADAILVLGGGTWPQTKPRPTAEVAEAGDRVLYAAYLFTNGKAPRIICTSGIATGSSAAQPASVTMSEILENVGVPKTAIVQESGSRNTYEHGTNLQPMLQDLGFKRIFLVTSALHMPRSVAVFKKNCPLIEFIPAPTDYRVVDLALPWYRELVNLIPTPSAYVQFSETMHEYLGMLWYKLRGRI